MNIKALSLWQPWASMIALGVKHHETRSWPTSYRGLLAIHAAKRWTADEIDVCTNPYGPVAPVLAQRGLAPDDLPRGAVLCVVQLVDVIRTEQAVVSGLDPVDKAFGNYRAGRFAWVLKLHRVFEQPVPTRGEQGLFNWEWKDGYR